MSDSKIDSYNDPEKGTPVHDGFVIIHSWFLIFVSNSDRVPCRVHEAYISDLQDNVPRSKFRKLWEVVEKLDAYGVEARGIERVRPDERTQSCEYIFSLSCSRKHQILMHRSSHRGFLHVASCEHDYFHILTRYPWSVCLPTRLSRSCPCHRILQPLDDHSRRLLLHLGPKARYDIF